MRRKVESAAHGSALVSDDDSARPRAVSWNEYAIWVVEQWAQVLDSASDEKPIQRFLEYNPCLLPGGSAEVGYGHHGVWYDSVITQPSLVSSRKTRIPDFMWIPRDTVANRPVCIEIERPGKSWYTSAGAPRADLIQAIDQIDDWRTWFSSGTNAEQFAEAYIPARFRHRTLVPRFILIYGRDAEFRLTQSRHPDPEWLRVKRDALSRPDMALMTFDMLVPSYNLRNSVTLRGRLPRFEIVAVPPTLETGPGLPEELLTHAYGLTTALTRTPLLTDDRRDYLSVRWNRWSNALAESSPRDMSQTE